MTTTKTAEKLAAIFKEDLNLKSLPVSAKSKKTKEPVMKKSEKSFAASVKAQKTQTKESLDFGKALVEASVKKDISINESKDPVMQKLVNSIAVKAAEEPPVAPEENLDLFQKELGGGNGVEFIDTEFGPDEDIPPEEDVFDVEEESVLETLKDVDSLATEISEEAVELDSMIDQLDDIAEDMEEEEEIEESLGVEEEIEDAPEEDVKDVDVKANIVAFKVTAEQLKDYTVDEAVMVDIDGTDTAGTVSEVNENDSTVSVELTNPDSGIAGVEVEIPEEQATPITKAKKKVKAGGGSGSAEGYRENMVFVKCIDGDSFSPYWNVYVDFSDLTIEFEGTGIWAPNRLLEDIVPDFADLTREDIIEEVKQWLEDDEYVEDEYVEDEYVEDEDVEDEDVEDEDGNPIEAKKKVTAILSDSDVNRITEDGTYMANRTDSGWEFKTDNEEEKSVGYSTEDELVASDNDFDQHLKHLSYLSTTAKKKVKAENETVGFAITVTLDDEDETEGDVTEAALKVEQKALEWLEDNYGTPRDEGHDSDGDLIGTLFIDKNLERIKEMMDNEPLRTSSGTLSDTDFLEAGDPSFNISIEFFDLRDKDDNPIDVEAKKKVKAEDNWDAETEMIQKHQEKKRKEKGYALFSEDRFQKAKDVAEKHIKEQLKISNYYKDPIINPKIFMLPDAYGESDIIHITLPKILEDMIDKGSFEPMIEELESLGFKVEKDNDIASFKIYDYNPSDQPPTKVSTTDTGYVRASKKVKAKKATEEELNSWLQARAKKYNIPMPTYIDFTDDHYEFSNDEYTLVCREVPMDGSIYCAVKKGDEIIEKESFDPIAVVIKPLSEGKLSFEIEDGDFSGTVTLTEDERSPDRIEWDESPEDWEDQEEKIMDAVNSYLGQNKVNAMDVPSDAKSTEIQKAIELLKQNNIDDSVIFLLEESVTPEDTEFYQSIAAKLEAKDLPSDAKSKDIMDAIKLLKQNNINEDIIFILEDKIDDVDKESYKYMAARKKERKSARDLFNR